LTTGQLVTTRQKQDTNVLLGELFLTVLCLNYKYSLWYFYHWCKNENIQLMRENAFREIEKEDIPNSFIPSYSCFPTTILHTIISECIVSNLPGNDHNDCHYCISAHCAGDCKCQVAMIPWILVATFSRKLPISTLLLVNLI